MKLFYQFCYCNNKKTKNKDFGVTVIYTFLTIIFSFTFICDIIFTNAIVNAGSAISALTCEHTYEYNEAHRRCESLTNQIKETTKIAQFHETSTTVHEQADYLAKEIGHLLTETKQTFQVLKEKQRICATDFASNVFPKVFQFDQNVFWFNQIIFVMSIWCFIKSCKTTPASTFFLPDEYDGIGVYRLVLAFFTSFVKPICILLVSLMLKKTFKVDNYLLNC